MITEQHPDAPPRPPRAAVDDDIRLILPVVLLVILTPLTFGLLLWAYPGAEGDPPQRVAVTLADAALALVVVTAIPLWTRMRLRPVGLLTTGLLATLAVALAVNPSPRGFELAWRLLGVAATATLVAQAGRRARTVLLATLLAVGTVESVIGIAQSARGTTSGLTGLELPGFLFTFGSSTAGRGGFGHPYHLAVFLLVAIGAGLVGVRRSPRPAPWLAGLCVCGAGIGVTYGRGALLGLLTAVAVVAVTAARRRELVWGLAVVAVLAGFGLTAASFGDGWLGRASQSTDRAQVDSQRSLRLAEAGRLIRRSPVTGVGPGHYVIALRDVPHAELLPAHNVVFHEAAEGGVLAGAFAAALLLALLVRSVRGGAEAMVVFLPIVPFLVFDAYPYIFPTGLAMAGIWIGLFHAATRPDTR